MGRQRTKEEWIELFKLYEKNQNEFWSIYLSSIKHTVAITKRNIKTNKGNFRNKYYRYKRHGDTIITSMTGKNSNGGPKKKINWDDFTREELIEIAKRYKEITKDKSKGDKMKEGSSLSIPVDKVAFLLDLSRSGIYKNKGLVKTSKRDPKLEELIRNIFIENRKIYGRDRIVVLLEQYGFFVSYRTVGRYMKALGLICKTRQACRKSESKNTKVKFPNLVKRNYNGDSIISTDVSYIPIKSENTNHAYLSIAINHKTKEIESWNFSLTNDNELVMKHFREMDLNNKIVHSDHGNQYSSNDFRELAEKLNFQISMSRIGNSLDNRESEYFFSNIKSECLNHIQTFKMSFEEVREIISNYITWYNTVRIQSILEWKTPEQARMSN